MLFFPWRNETEDLLKSLSSYSEAFIPKQPVVLENKQKFEYVSEEMSDSLQHILEEGIFPESIWDDLAPEVQHENELSAREGIVVDKNLQVFCPDDFVEIQSNNCHLSSTLALTSESRINTVSNSEFSSMVFSLNKEQPHIFQNILDWCCKSINHKIDPFHIFCTGGAGVSKSHLINTILQMANRILKKPGDDPAEIVIHLAAPTGTAAYNIGGTTLHNSFLLPLAQSDKHTSLSAEKLSSLRNKY